MNPRLEKILGEYAERKVRALNKDEVLNKLKAAGITTLEQLVEARLADFHRGGDVAKETFIYTQFIYTKEMPIDHALLDRIESGLRGG